MSTRYGFGKQVALAFDRVIERVTAELQKEGFGVLTDIDVSATVKKKLDEDMPPYRILGACNPKLAHHQNSTPNHCRLGVLPSAMPRFRLRGPRYRAGFGVALPGMELVNEAEVPILAHGDRAPHVILCLAARACAAIRVQLRRRADSASGNFDRGERSPRPGNQVPGQCVVGRQRGRIDGGVAGHRM